MSRDRHAVARRLLLVSFHFGDNGATGGFRWAAMVQDLAADGWEIDVLTSSESDCHCDGVEVHYIQPATWPTRLTDTLISAPLRLLRSRTASGAPKTALASSAATDERDTEALRRRVEAIPIWRVGDRLSTRTMLGKSHDAVIGYASALDWARRAGRLGADLVRRRGHAAVLVSSPPHATQWAGRTIARRTGIPYIADFRDPWAIGVAELDGYDSPVTRHLGAWLERRTQRAAHTVVHNNDVALERALAQPSLPSVPRVCIPNGYDGEPTTARPDRAAFRILFAGWIHAFMDPRVLLRAVETLRREDPEGTAALRLEFIGSPTMIHDVPLAEVVRAYGLADCTSLSPRVSREEAMRAQERAAVLVAFDCPHPLAVAMKFYDYLLMRGELLLIAEPDSALDRAARRVGSRAVAPGDHDGLVAALRRALARWQADDYPHTNDPARLLHRTHRTAEVRALLDSVVASGAAARPAAGATSTVAT